MPVHNEAANLRPLYEELTQVLAAQGISYEVLFVEDGSTDNSLERLQAIAADDAAVRLLVFDQHYGQTAALLAGFHHARGDEVVALDADGQNPPAAIPALLGLLREGYDLVSGWRRARQDAWWRVLPSWLANRLISGVGGLRLHDYGCTLKAYRRGWVARLYVPPGHHRYLPLYLYWQGARVAELAVPHRPRTQGRSKYGMGRVFRVLGAMPALLRAKRRAQTANGLSPPAPTPPPYRLNPTATRPTPRPTHER